MATEVKYRQHNPWGCGIYAIANACNLDSFITEERLSKSKLHGNTIGQLSRWLQDDGHPYAIDALYYNHDEGKIPDKHLEYAPTGPDIIEFLPVLLNVKKTRHSLRHMVGGKLNRQGQLFLYDSMKPNVVLTTLAEANQMYEHVFGLFVLLSIETGDYVFINKSS